MLPFDGKKTKELVASLPCVYSRESAAANEHTPDQSACCYGTKLQLVYGCLKYLKSPVVMIWFPIKPDMLHALTELWFLWKVFNDDDEDSSK